MVLRKQSNDIHKIVYLCQTFQTFLIIAELKEDGFGPKVRYRCLVAEPTDHRNLTEGKNHRR